MGQVVIMQSISALINIAEDRKERRSEGGGDAGKGHEFNLNLCPRGKKTPRLLMRRLYFIVSNSRQYKNK